MAEGDVQKGKFKKKITLKINRAKKLLNPIIYYNLFRLLLS